MNKQLYAGAAQKDITPNKKLFLYGYPHVQRISEGVNDPLFASAMVLYNGKEKIATVSLDVIYTSKLMIKKVREIVSDKSDIPANNIVISATHTHSGPVIIDSLFTEDKVVPKADKEYLNFLNESIVEIILEANNNLYPSEIAFTSVNVEGIGGNRRNKEGAADSEVPVIVLRKKSDSKIFSISTIYSMHPTVLHEDSKLYSADFPGYTRKYIIEKLGGNIIFLYHTGPSGNQSPRHYTKSNTFAEAERLGNLLGKQITDAVDKIPDNDFRKNIDLWMSNVEIDLPRRQFTKTPEAKLKSAVTRLEELRMLKTNKIEIRTAECDWFGAEEELQLVKMYQSGVLEKTCKTVLPAEVTVLRIENKNIVWLPGELYVEFSLELKSRSELPVYCVSLANGDLYGYVVTPEAYKEGGYEASCSLFPPEAGYLMIEEALKLIKMKQHR